MRCWGFEESWFFELKYRSLQRRSEVLSRSPPGGGPRAPATPEQERIAALENRIRQLELEFRAAQLCAELEQAGRPRASKEAKPAPKKARP